MILALPNLDFFNLKTWTNILINFYRIDEFHDSGIQLICKDLMTAIYKQKGLVGENLVYCDINHPFHPDPYNKIWYILISEDFEQWLR